MPPPETRPANHRRVSSMRPASLSECTRRPTTTFRYPSRAWHRQAVASRTTTCSRTSPWPSTSPCRACSHRGPSQRAGGIMSIDSAAATSVSAMSSRRAFILTGSALVAGATLLRREAPIPNGGLSALAGSQGPRIGVGYVQGSADATSLESMLAAGGARVVPASTLVSGDLNNQAAALLVHGFSPGVACDGSCKYNNVFDDAHLPSPDVSSAEPTVPFYAWT